MGLRSLFSWFSSDLAVDLGTANTLVFAEGGAGVRAISFAACLPAVAAAGCLDETARRALAAVGLSERADHRPQQLSGGERQRVAIARSTVMGPSILLADEPTGNLDSKSGREVIELLEAMNRDGLTLIVVTHDPAIGQRARGQVRLVDGAIVR